MIFVLLPELFWQWLLGQFCPVVPIYFHTGIKKSDSKPDMLYENKTDLEEVEPFWMLWIVLSIIHLLDYVFRASCLMSSDDTEAQLTEPVYLWSLKQTYQSIFLTLMGVT